MIEFDCPKCGEPMEVKDRMAGRKVRCVECDRLVRVPDDDDDNDDDFPNRPAAQDQGMSGAEFVLYGLICLAVPGINVLVTSVLYYAWKSTTPKRASQINTLGFVIFGIHALCICAFIIMTRAVK